MSTLRVLLVTPAAAMRVGLQALLNEGNIEVIGDLPSLDGYEAFPPELDVVIVTDEVVPTTVTAIRRLHRPPALLLLSSSAHQLDTLRTGSIHAWGIVPLDASGAALRAAVAALAEGFIVLPETVAGSLLPVPRAAGELADPLTTRELEILGLLGQGLANRDIAYRLQISEHTVKFHLTSIFGKLGASSRTEAVALGARQGLITL